MIEFLSQTMRVITLDLFIGYGLFTLLWLLVSLTKGHDELIETLDLRAGKFMRILGIIYLLCVMTMIIISFITMDNYQVRWYPLIQVLVWTIATQLLWIEKIRKNRMLRFVFAILFIVSFEMFVIVLTSLHRDYSNDGLFSGSSTTDIIMGLTSKTVVFCILAIVYSFVVEKLKRLRAT